MYKIISWSFIRPHIFSVSYKNVKINVSILLNINKLTMSFYAVAKGRNPGIYKTWNDCKLQVDKFPGPIFKKFSTKVEAENFIKERTNTPTYSKSPSNFQKKLFLAGKNNISDKSKTFQTKSSSSKRLLSTESDGISEDLSNKSNKRRKICLISEPSKTKNENGFFVDENGYTEVYTDGACSSNGRGNAKAGVGVWFADENPFNVSKPVVGRATNNMAEIQAITIAAQQAKKAGVKKLKIYTDSKFVISCITQWMPKWKRTNWKTANGAPVINKTELLEMEKALATLQVSWNHVRGHQGILGNEKADLLARNGCEHYTGT